MPNLTPDQITRLRDSISRSEIILNEFRKHRMEALKEYLGAHYSQQGTATYNPVNLLYLYVSIYMRSLVARQPRVLINTPYTQYKPTAANLEMALDVLMKRIRFAESLRRCVMEAMFGVGVMYIGINKSSTVEIGGVTHDVGQPFADPLFLDEVTFDMSARTFEQMQYISHSYLMPKDDYFNCGLFDTSVQVQSAIKKPVGFGGNERSETLSTGGRTFENDYKEYVRLRNIWLPLDKCVVTVEDTLDGQSSTEVLREVAWEGPECGPYRMLRFNEVPGNIMPLAPIANLIDIHRLENNIWRKIDDMARNTKTVLGFGTGADKDAERIANASNMEIIRMDNPDKLKEYNFNSVDNQLLALGIQFKDLFSWLGGNLDTLGGLSPMSKTVGQDELLSESASKQVSDMQEAVTDFTTQCIQDLAHYLWHDPLIHIPLTKRIRNTDIEVPTAFNALTKEGDFLDYNLTIDPYSMQHSTPQTKLAAIQNVLANVIMPLQPVMEQQQLTIDVRSLLKQVGRYSDLPEIYEIVTSMAAPMQPDASPTQDPPAKAPVTTRNYVRTSRTAGPTRPAKDNAMMQTLLGGGVQGKEMEGAVGA